MQITPGELTELLDGARGNVMNEQHTATIRLVRRLRALVSEAATDPIEFHTDKWKQDAQQAILQAGKFG